MWGSWSQKRELKEEMAGHKKDEKRGRRGGEELCGVGAFIGRKGMVVKKIN